MYMLICSGFFLYPVIVPTGNVACLSYRQATLESNNRGFGSQLYILEHNKLVFDMYSLF